MTIYAESNRTENHIRMKFIKRKFDQHIPQISLSKSFLTQFIGRFISKSYFKFTQLINVSFDFMQK